MTGRRAIFGAAAVGLLTCVGLFAGPASPTRAAPPGQPNVILIVTDDQTARAFAQGVMPRTREIVADGGTKFRNYWVSTAQCCPSRATMLTGQYGHNNGVLSNRAGYPALLDPDNTLPVWLQQAGYSTIHIGKYLQGYGHVEHDGGAGPGWGKWFTAYGPTYYDYTIVDRNGDGERHGRGAGDYVTTVFNRIASRQVRKLGRRTKPFYMQLDHRAPHTESGNNTGGRCAGVAQPAPSDQERFDGVKAPHVPSFNESDLTDKPHFLRRARLGPDEREGLDRRWGCALASLRQVDRGVAEIARSLRAIGELDQTVIAFTSDNGVFYGEHRIYRGKVVPYTEDHHVPLAIRVPGRYLSGERADSVGRVVSNVDLAPTILDLAGAEACRAPGECRTMDGRSLVPLIDGSGPWPGDRSLLYEFSDSRAGRYAVCEYAGLWSKDAKLTHYTRIANEDGSCSNRNVYERYDLEDDPFELRNLCARHCPNSGGQAALEARLSELEVCAGIAGRDPLPGSGEYCE